MTSCFDERGIVSEQLFQKILKDKLEINAGMLMETTTSLEKCVRKYSTHLAQAYIVHTGDVEKDGDYLYIPLYMVPCL